MMRSQVTTLPQTRPGGGAAAVEASRRASLPTERTGFIDEPMATAPRCGGLTSADRKAIMQRLAWLEKELAVINQRVTRFEQVSQS